MAQHTLIFVGAHPEDESFGPGGLLAEYALRGMDKPIGVSGFELTRELPENLQSSLPTIEEIERELEGDPS